MENVYNHASRAIKGTDCALHQCVRAVPVLARTLKLGRAVKVDGEESVEPSHCTFLRG